MLSVNSFFKYLINSKGTCVDVGCRNFIFAENIGKLCSRVIALDPGEDIEVPNNNKIIFLNQCLTVSDSSDVYLVKDGRQNAYYTSFEKFDNHCEKVPNISLKNLVKTFKLDSIDLIKLDCEGSEYSILYWLSQNPIARQISVQFHDNLNRNPYKNASTYYERLFAELKKHYYIVQHVVSDKGHGATNYDDSLFVRK